jgi:uncharacterized protein (TIGR00299 family) protein
MRIFLNLYGGVAGDMLVSALYDLACSAEADLAATDDLLAALPFEGVQVKFTDELRQGISGRGFKVIVSEDQQHRHLVDVLEIIDALPLTDRARSWSVAAFELLATAEAKVHHSSREQVHFHEVGAVDAIVDICLASCLMDLLNPQKIYSSPIPVGSGSVHCEHGEMPVPAPATLELLKNLPSCGFDLVSERATPTGVALLRAWQVDFSSRGAAITRNVGYGMGSNEYKDRANFLRVQLEELAQESECVVELRTMVDDQSGEVIGHALETLRQQPILEAYLLPVMAKDSRPGFEVVVLCDIGQQHSLSRLMFELLGTLGIRNTVLDRSTLRRCEFTSHGISHKLRMHSDSEQVIGRKAEFRDVVRQSEADATSPRKVLDDLSPTDGA